MAALFAAALSLSGAVAFAQESGKNATFSADEMTHDKDQGVITARGHVEVVQNGRTLLADSISYDQNRDVIRATGNVTLHNPTGEVLFADNMEITGDLKNGMIEDLMAVMADRSRFAAKKATLVNDETMTLERGVYSPCQPCQDDPSRPLVWQLKSVKVIHDRVNKIVEFEDAWLEFSGIPIIYTPYLSFPDPTVKRKSGFLPPRVGGSSSLGMVARTPYYYVLDDYSDVTVTPIITSKENGGLAAEYREKFTRGEITSETSAAYDANNNVLGHIDAKARFDINNDWRWGVDAQRASNSTYMRRYGFGRQDTLTSQAFLEGFSGRNYMNFSSMAFQGLRATDDPKTTPVVLPLAEYSHQGEPGRLGAYNTLDVNMAMLTRDLGADTKRVSVKPSWNLPYVAPMGDIYKLSASMGLDFFHSQSLAAPTARERDGTYDGAALRANPELSLDWRWPLARRTGTVTEILEPIGQVIVSPYGGNSWKMANEDSQDLDFNDTNLFSANRYTGYDRVEGGPRTNYGVKWGVYGDGGGSTSILVGQSYRLKADDTFQTGSGLEKNFSDYVAKLQVSPNENFDMVYRTRLDQDTYDFRRNEVGVSGTASPISYSASYAYFDRLQNGEYDGRKELSYGLGAKLTDMWSTQFSGVRDLSQDGGQRDLSWGFIYEDECFRFDTVLSRTFYLDREIKPTEAIMFRLVFKTLGEVGTDVSAN